MSQKHLDPQKRSELEAKVTLGIEPESVLEDKGQSASPPTLSLKASKGQPVQRREPELPGSTPSSVSYTPHNNEGLFYYGTDQQRVHENDVQQGNINNCYLMASISALARSNPSFIENLITDNQDGTYGVKLYLSNQRGRRSWRTVTVTGNFPMIGGSRGYTPTFAQFGDNNEIWVMLLEKAYAKAIGGYDDLDAAGDPASALLRLSGSSGDTHYIKFMNESKIIQKITEGLNAGAPVVLGTPGAYATDLVADYREMAERAGVVIGHAYSAVSVSGNNVTMWNPQGTYVTFSAEQIKLFFLRFTVGRRPG